MVTGIIIGIVVGIILMIIEKNTPLTKSKLTVPIDNRPPAPELIEKKPLLSHKHYANCSRA